LGTARGETVNGYGTCLGIGFWLTFGLKPIPEQVLFSISGV
jgi:hypothetical protein